MNHKTLPKHLKNNIVNLPSLPYTGHHISLVLAYALLFLMSTIFKASVCRVLGNLPLLPNLIVMKLLQIIWSGLRKRRDFASLCDEFVFSFHEITFNLL